MPVAAYFRVASVCEHDRDPFAGQKEALERYCASHGLTISRQYCDSGVSGLLPLDQRPAGKRLVADARSGRFDQLLVCNIDRLGRSTQLVLTTIKELERYGVCVRSVVEQAEAVVPIID